ncbi:META domain-containing protein [Campylobacter sp. VTCC 70190]|uniref:META domain-containing protein n=1 Tax=Campylobacter sp. VTCC 70190 TaxID=3392118 RepID=UPI00398F8726
MKKILQIALAAAFFAGCASNSVNSNSTKSVELTQNQPLQIEKIIVKGKMLEAKNAEEIPNISFDKNKFYGYAGCNRFFGSYQNSGTSLQFEGAASTQMLCHPLDVMDFENSLLSNLKGEFKMTKEDNKLILSSENMTIYFK